MGNGTGLGLPWGHPHDSCAVTAFTSGNLPSSINTYERLAFWVAQVLQDTAGSLMVNVVPNQPSVPRAQVQLAKIADGTDTAVLTLYIPIDWDAINSPTAKSWMAALEITTATQNSVYNSN